MTQLIRWYNDKNGVQTRDTWIIPESADNVWCTGLEHDLIKIFGDCEENFADLTKHDRNIKLVGAELWRAKYIDRDWLEIAC